MMWGLRLLLIGVIAVIVGGVYLYHGLNGGDPDGIFSDGLVKGPIGLMVGVALLDLRCPGAATDAADSPAGVTWVGDEGGEQRG